MAWYNFFLCCSNKSIRKRAEDELKVDQFAVRLSKILHALVPTKEHGASCIKGNMHTLIGQLADWLTHVQDREEGLHAIPKMRLDSITPWVESVLDKLREIEKSPKRILVRGSINLLLDNTSEEPDNIQIAIGTLSESGALSVDTSRDVLSTLCRDFELPLLSSESTLSDAPSEVASPQHKSP